MVQEKARADENQVTIAQVRREVAAAVEVIHRELRRVQAALGIDLGDEEGER